MPMARSSEELALIATAPIERPSDGAVTRPRRKQTQDDDIGPLAEPPAPVSIPDEDTGRRRKPAPGPETAAFVADAKEALVEASKDLAAKDLATKDLAAKDLASNADELAIPHEPAEPQVRDSDPEISIKHEEPARPGPGARKRAATLPPTAAMLRRPPTVPPPSGGISALFGTNATVPSAPALNATLPPPSAIRGPAIVMEESPDGTMKIEPAKLASDAAITQPRMARAEEPDFGTDTPVKAPTRAELQALLDTPPDPTRKQTVEEIEALHMKALDRPSDPELVFDRRPHPTAEVTEDDIEAAIELAPAARKSSLGVAKKKPE
jgi:hypothetical protein